jgi:hypothetical protein
VIFSFSASYIALWAVVLFQGLLVLALLQQLANLRRVVAQGGLAEDRLPDGSQAPEFANVDKRLGRQLGVRTLDGSGGIILFLSSECSVCKGLVDRIGRFAPDDLPPIITFCQGREQGCARFGERLGTRIRLILDGAEKTGARYRISRFPTAVVVDGGRKIRGYGYPRDIREVKNLWARSRGEASNGRVSGSSLVLRVDRG